MSAPMWKRCGLDEPDAFLERVGYGRRCGRTTRLMLDALEAVEAGKPVVYVGTSKALDTYRGMLDDYARAAGVDVSSVKFCTPRGARDPDALVFRDHYLGEV